MATAAVWASGNDPRRAKGAAASVPRPVARSCILVYLLGGPPHQDTFDLKPHAPAEIRGPFSPIDTDVPGVQICEHLPLLSQQASRYALVRSVSHPNSNHTPMIYYTLTGRPVERPQLDNDVRPPLRTDFPHVGAVLARYRPHPETLPGYVALPELAVRTGGENPRGWMLLRGGAAGFLGPTYDPLCVNGEPGTRGALPALELPAGVDDDRFARRAALLAALDRPRGRLPEAGRQHDLRNLAVSLTGAAAGPAQPFALDGEPAALRDRYGRGRFGQALLLARRLAEAGVPMISVHFNNMSQCDGWDTHSNNFRDCQRELLPLLDQGLSALLADLADRGQLEQTMVVCLGEFGRTPRINGNAGRDHWGDCSAALLAGGGIQGGQIVGASDPHAAYPTERPIDPVDLHATILHCLGVDPAGEMQDHLQRPWPLCDGRVVLELI